MSDQNASEHPDLRRLAVALPVTVVVVGAAALLLRAEPGAGSAAVSAAHAAALTAPTLVFWTLVLSVVMLRYVLSGIGVSALAGFGVGLGWSLVQLALAPGLPVAPAGGMLGQLRDGLAVIQQAPLLGMLTALLLRAMIFGRGFRRRAATAAA